MKKHSKEINFPHGSILTRSKSDIIIGEGNQINDNCSIDSSKFSGSTETLNKLKSKQRNDLYSQNIYDDNYYHHKYEFLKQIKHEPLNFNNDDDNNHDYNDNHSSDDNNSDRSLNNSDDEDFQLILSQIRMNINKNNEHDDNLKINNQFIESNNNNNNINHNNYENKNDYHSNLKCLYKLLKFYKLEHYMNDLVDAGYSTSISIQKLEHNDLDKLNVSPYDKKKFLKLKLFIKQGIKTIKTQTPHQTTTTTTSKRTEKSCINKRTLLKTNFKKDKQTKGK
jgi:hypothetical protein